MLLVIIQRYTGLHHYFKQKMCPIFKDEPVHYRISGLNRLDIDLFD